MVADHISDGRLVPVLDEERRSIERVKLAALSTGVHIDGDVLDRLGGADALTVHEYATTGGITLVLPHGVLVNAPFDEPYSVTSLLRLTDGASGLELVLEEVVVPVLGVLPLPGYLEAVDRNGRLVSSTVMSHADRIRVSPIVGCAFNCGFCDLGTMRYERRPIEQLLDAIDVALNDEALPTGHLLISGGSAASPDEHQQYFSRVCVAITQHVKSLRPDFEVDIMMSPREDAPEFVEQMVATGVTGFSFNIEVFSEPAAKRHLPLKYRNTRAHFEAAIRAAVAMLGRDTGRVRSLIIPGLESVDQTLAGVKWLASLGCHPVLSPFRPARGTALEDAAPPTEDELQKVLEQSRVIASEHGVALGPRCVPCQHNTLSFPWDAVQAVASVT